MNLKVIFILLSISLKLGAQSFSEDFSNTQTGNVANAWIEKNLDGLTVAGQISNYGIGTKAWTCVDLSSKYPEHGHVMCSTSWYIPSGTSNDWLISPPFAVSANSMLSWEAMCGDKYNADGYEVRISLGGVQPADFTITVANINLEAGDWKTHYASLNNFTNQIIRIAFVNKSTNKYLLFLDNVDVRVPITNDGGVLNLNSHSKFFNGVFQSFFKPFCGTIKNYGFNPLSSAQIGFQVKHDTIVYETFQFSPPINYQETRPFCFSYFPTTCTDTTNNKLKAWTSMVNNVSESNHNNDTAKKDLYLPEYNTYSIPKADLLEMFGSSNSEACASVFPSFDSLLIQKGANYRSNFNVIKYQIESPPELIDPSSNKFALARKNYYQVNYVPNAIINGTYSVLNFDKTTLNFLTGGYSYFDLRFVFSYPYLENGVLTSTLNLTSLYNLRNESPIRVFIVLNQKHYKFKNCTSSQKDFYQVLRTMIPNEHGQVV
ncbi:MAG: choice-of-anchor J domain-containing protein, partial [Bacteroidota bacterium]